ncbi:hypothetical protein [Yoonia sp.]|uniref:hypothetical protein n=1 Tax=Yoonia sp. TaxID=2212373 RepID=UPI00391B83C1
MKKLMMSTFCAAMIVAPAMVSAGSLAPVVADQVVVVPQQQGVAPAVGSLSGPLVAGVALIALVALASSSSSTSSTNGTN